MPAHNISAPPAMVRAPCRHLGICAGHFAGQSWKEVARLNFQCQLERFHFAAYDTRGIGSAHSLCAVENPRQQNVLRSNRD